MVMRVGMAGVAVGVSGGDVGDGGIRETVRVDVMVWTIEGVRVGVGEAIGNGDGSTASDSDEDDTGFTVREWMYGKNNTMPAARRRIPQANMPRGDTFPPDLPRSAAESISAFPSLVLSAALAPQAGG